MHVMLCMYMYLSVYVFFDRLHMGTLGSEYRVTFKSTPVLDKWFMTLWHFSTCVVFYFSYSTRILCICCCLPRISMRTLSLKKEKRLCIDRIRSGTWHLTYRRAFLIHTSNATRQVDQACQRNFGQHEGKWRRCPMRAAEPINTIGKFSAVSGRR